jgi:hypothetical protein
MYLSNNMLNSTFRCYRCNKDLSCSTIFRFMDNSYCAFVCTANIQTNVTTITKTEIDENPITLPKPKSILKPESNYTKDENNDVESCIIEKESDYGFGYMFLELISCLFSKFSIKKLN